MEEDDELKHLVTFINEYKRENCSIKDQKGSIRIISESVQVVGLNWFHNLMLVSNIIKTA